MIPEPTTDKTSLLTTLEMVKLIKAIDLGAPVAEHDTILEEARIETSTFTDLFRDRVDLVPGTKGSGKTALYRLISEFSKEFMLKTRIVILTGVEATGDPVFQAFKSRFESLNETEFENFWRVYFVALILQRFICDDGFSELLECAHKEIQEFKQRCRKAKIPEPKHSRSFQDIVDGVLRCVKWKFGNAEQSVEGTAYSLVEVEPTEDAHPSAEKEQSQPVFLNEIHDAIISVLNRADIKIWIMLDRLDEVFPRRTNLEKTALRGLLRTTRNFPTPRIRIKLFLRDDVFDSVIGKDGFTALSHIEARKAPTLSWGIKDIQLLIVKRFAANHRLRSVYNVVLSRIIENDMRHVGDVFNRLFPPQVVPGKTQSDTLEWIYSHCADGGGVVTPRDVIDLLEFALKAQIDNLERLGETTHFLIQPQALKDGLKELSKKKRRTYLEAEFPEFWEDISRFEDQKAEHHPSSLYELLGPKWQEKVHKLRAVGFLQHRPKHKTYVVPFLFRAGMGIRQGKAS
jgi:hypothetical protein